VAYAGPNRTSIGADLPKSKLKAEIHKTPKTNQRKASNEPITEEKPPTLGKKTGSMNSYMKAVNDRNNMPCVTDQTTNSNKDAKHGTAMTKGDKPTSKFDKPRNLQSDSNAQPVKEFRHDDLKNKTTLAMDFAPPGDSDSSTSEIAEILKKSQESCQSTSPLKNVNDSKKFMRTSTVIFPRPEPNKNNSRTQKSRLDLTPVATSQKNKSLTKVNAFASKSINDD
jgi:hypothetical protein